MKISSMQGAFLLQILKGVVVAVLFSLVSVVAFAFILEIFDISDKIIKPINQLIKTLAIVLGCFLSVRECLFIAKGGLIGFLSALFTLLIFALISSVKLSFTAVLIDAVFGFLIGVVSALIVKKVTCS